MLEYSPTPIQPIDDPSLIAAGVQLFVKREDLNHPYVSGNKWWKLKMNLTRALTEGHDQILTFGGAFSNHIYATAAAAKAVGLRSVGIIRGEEPVPLNSTLRFADDCGMQLHFISRATYRNKDETLLSTLISKFGRCYIIPEGGSNEPGVAGVAAFSEQLSGDFDFICCPIGTGATMAGLIRGRHGAGQLIGFAVLKGGDAWNEAIKHFNPGYSNWITITNYHFGGYAKTNATLEQFIKRFAADKNVPLEHVYSGKMFYGIMELVSNGYFPRGSRILAIHTGGLRSNDYTWKDIGN